VKYLWVDSGNDPDLAKCVKHGIDGLFFDMFDTRLSENYLKTYVESGYKVGIYMASNWSQFNLLLPSEIANAVFTRAKKIGGKSFGPDFPKVQFDMEEKNPVRILNTLKEWRILAPKHSTSWTMECFQGGWMSDEFVKGILSTKVRIVPQAYTGDMRDFAEDMVLRDLLRRGFPENIISLFYDAADVPLGWSGFAFTQGRLP
jgi:hypothetical protein